jgi:hypothetical protein
MVGLERHTREERVATAPTSGKTAAPAGATALEVAALRERMDGVSMKLGDVDRRVGVLEASRDHEGALSSNVEPVKPEPAGEPGDVPAMGTSKDGTRADAPTPSRIQPESFVAASPASVDGTADVHPRVPALASSSVVLMLTDAQFQRWLGSGATSPTPDTEHKPTDEEGQVDWRLRRNAARVTRGGRP